LAEVGHVVIDWRAWRDGEPSTVEELGSGSGVARQARKAGLGAVSSEAVEAAAVAGEPQAVAIWEQAIAACAAGVSNLVMSFSPSIVVIGGGMGRQDAFFGPVRDMVLEHPGHLPTYLTIVRSSLGDDAGLSGAAAWARATAPA
jgi:glucokinase